MSSIEKLFVNRTSERTARKFIELLSSSRVQLVQGELSIMELGAGKGTLSYSLYRLLNPRSLTVTDYDPSQIALAESYFRAKLGSIPSNVEIKTADAQSLAFSNENFDLVVASHVLHHIEKRDWNFRNIPRALMEIHRVLKPGGYFIYEEIFSKSKIKKKLTELGFAELFEKSPWLSDCFYVFRKSFAIQNISSDHA